MLMLTDKVCRGTSCAGTLLSRKSRVGCRQVQAYLPNADVLACPKAGVPVWANSPLAELAPPKRVFEVLDPNKLAPVPAPKPPACVTIRECSLVMQKCIMSLSTTIEGLPGDMPKAGVVAGLAEAPKPKLGPEDVLAPNPKPELCTKQRPGSGVKVHQLTKVLTCKNVVWEDYVVTCALEDGVPNANAMRFC